MTNEKMENETPKNETEKETPQTPETETLETPEGDNPLETKELQSALAQKEHFREKFEKANKQLSELQAKPNSDLPLSQNPMEVVKLAKALEGFNEDEVEFITRNASDKSIDGIISATKDEWVDTAIQAKREKVEKEKQIPEPTTTQTISKKAVEDITADDLEKMSIKEKEDYLQKVGFHK